MWTCKSFSLSSRTFYHYILKSFALVVKAHRLIEISINCLLQWRDNNTRSITHSHWKVCGREKHGSPIPCGMAWWTPSNMVSTRYASRWHFSVHSVLHASEGLIQLAFWHVVLYMQLLAHFYFFLFLWFFSFTLPLSFFFFPTYLAVTLSCYFFISLNFIFAMAHSKNNKNKHPSTKTNKNLNTKERKTNLIKRISLIGFLFFCFFFSDKSYLDPD